MLYSDEHATEAELGRRYFKVMRVLGRRGGLMQMIKGFGVLSPVGAEARWRKKRAGKNGNDA